MATNIDKKELKEPDKLQIFFLRCRAFVEKHKIRIYTGAGVFLLITILTGGWYLYQLSYETNAAKLYATIFETMMKTGSPTGDSAAVKGYKELITQYPRSQAALTAYYRLGNLYFSRHEADAAISAYQNFLDKAPADSDLFTLAYNGLGSAYEVTKNFNKSLQSYEIAIKNDKTLSFEALNYGAIARVYEAMNNPQKAVESYRKALEKTSDPLMALYLKRKIAILG